MLFQSVSFADNKLRDALFWLAIFFSICFVLWVEFMTAAPVDEWVLYLFPIGLSLLQSRALVPYIVAGLVTLLTILDLVYRASEPHFEADMLSRFFGILVYFFIAALGSRQIAARHEMEREAWLSTGRAMVIDAIKDVNELAGLASTVLQYLAGYTGAVVGTVYACRDRSQAVYLAGFACATPPPSTRFGPGESLVGECLASGKAMIVSDLPPGYLQVNSSLGAADVVHVALFPVSFYGATQAVLELGFIKPPPPLLIDLLAELDEPIGSVFAAQYSQERREELLARTQEQARELEEQKERLNRVNQELEKQTTELEDSQSRLENQQTELEQVNERLEEQAQELEIEKSQVEVRNRELDEARRRLVEANRYKTDFLSSMSHELRTPLNSMLILANLLAENGEGRLSDEQVRHAEMIGAAGEDLLDLINDILDLAKVEAGKLQLRPDEVKLASVLNRMKETFAPVAERKSIRFEVETEGALPVTMQTDRTRLEQILKNLLSNALKFTEEGEVVLKAIETPEHVRFAVRDTGPGIEESRQKEIFEAFQQLDQGISREYGGTGLGLSISSRLASLLGGRIELESTVGEGSEFVLELPLEWHGEPGREIEPPTLVDLELPAESGSTPEKRPAEEAPAAPGKQKGKAPRTLPTLPDDRSAIDPSKRTLLVVEDDLVFAGILRDAVRNRGFQCLVATTTAEAQWLLQSHAIEGVLLDVHLPDASGLVLLDQLKSNLATRHIPVHLLSVDDYEEQAMGLGAIGYALKPIRREQMDQVLGRLEAKINRQLKNVLIVEDNETEREAISELLKGTDVQLHFASTGAEALDAVANKTFDCMVLDLTLPDVSGFDLLEQMADSPRFSHPPVVVYTGRELTREQEDRLRRYTQSIVIKGARSPERLLDEASLFLHRMESEIPSQRRTALRELQNRNANLEGRHLLLVDDDVRNVFALSALLEQKGAVVHVARNGREAIEKLQQTPEVELVLMDIMMPEMDGFEATRRIRQMEGYGKLPIIAVTAKAASADREAVIEAGANDYLSKPVDTDKLFALIQVWLPRYAG